MPIEHTGTSSLVDVLDRVLDKGVVIDGWLRVSVVGIDLITVEARIVVASIQTYLQSADAIALRALSTPPRLTEATTIRPMKRLQARA